MNNNNNLVLDVEDNPKKIVHWLLFALQHILAMFVACITVPLPEFATCIKIKFSFHPKY